MKIIISFLFIFIFSCDKKSRVKTYSISKNQVLPVKENKVSTNLINSFSWITPKHWTEGKLSSMRLASYTIPFNGGTGDLSITNFSGDGGGLLANVNRWRGQLNLSPYGLENLESQMMTGTSGIGEFQIIKIINIENNLSAFLCAIYDIGGSTIFIKMTSSVLGINELELEFKEFCSTLNYNDR